MLFVITVIRHEGSVNGREKIDRERERVKLCDFLSYKLSSSLSFFLSYIIPVSSFLFFSFLLPISLFHIISPSFFFSLSLPLFVFLSLSPFLFPYSFTQGDLLLRVSLYKLKVRSRFLVSYSSLKLYQSPLSR